MEQVRRFFRGMSGSDILEYGLGFEKTDAPTLAKSTIVVVMDFEKFEFEPRCLTEYGLNTFTRKEMMPILANPGPHGENLLRNIYYYHIRVQESAHYVNRKWCPGNPENNRFGITRFATKQQAKDFLTSCIAWPVDETNPDGNKCLVIFLGHAVGNEIEMLQQELGVDPSVISNVVAIIDTQDIAREKGIRGRGQKIGLGHLMDVCDVSFRDAHTAGNDAAYTIIGALQMVIEGKFPNSPNRTLQAVVDALELYSRGVWPQVGVLNYCTRCGNFDHSRPQCYGRIKRCERCLKSGHEKAAYTHITRLCTHP
tara:strand:+ start:7453 stop:8385 length:933 start_codon:yes stop_codon:yes gene_type:complete